MPVKYLGELEYKWHPLHSPTPPHSQMDNHKNSLSVTLWKKSEGIENY